MTEPANISSRFESLPEPLANALKQIYSETNPFRTVHRLIDAVEVLVKLHTVIVLSDYFAGQDIANNIKALLILGLKTPSLGIWWRFCKDIASQLAKENRPFFCRRYAGLNTRKGQETQP